MKQWIATYIDPATGVDANEGDKRLRRHEQDCRYLRPGQPGDRRPYVGKPLGTRKAGTK